jgi:transcriptional regulator with XRE-family HTH domain
MNAPALPVEVAHRIRVERKRLNKSQDEIATLCASSREMWGRYERGTHPMPGNVLRSFIDAGADIQFLRSGTRTEAAPHAGGVSGQEISSALEVLQDLLRKQSGASGSKALVELSDDEYQLVQAYRGATPERREVFFDLVHAQKRRAMG